MRRLENIWRLGIKELFSLRRDIVLFALIVWSFSVAIQIAATGKSQDLRNASIAVVDEDRSQLSARIRDAFLPPQFAPPRLISFDEIDPGMDTGRYVFALVIPNRFEADVLAGNRPAVQVNVDATALMQAGIGANYIANILAQEIRSYTSDTTNTTAAPVRLETRYAFNPNIESRLFVGVMEVVNGVVMLSIILAGAAFIREREHGTLEHLLVMPLTPFEIMLAKVWANGFVILTAVAVSLWIVVERVLAVPVVGSIPLFLVGTVLYLFFSTALGIFLGTVVKSMPQFGLLFILAVLPMRMLSGGETPIESQPEILQTIMQAWPSTHFVSFAQSILFRDAGIEIVWPSFVTVAAIGILFFAAAAARFRHSISSARN